MGMSTHVNAVKPPDETWHKMKAIYDSCEDAGIAIPDEVSEYFEHDTPNPAGVEVSLQHPTHAAVEEIETDSSHGYRVDIRKLPKGCAFIEFRCSY